MLSVMVFCHSQFIAVPGRCMCGKKETMIESEHWLNSITAETQLNHSSSDFATEAEAQGWQRVHILWLFVSLHTPFGVLACLQIKGESLINVYQ